RDDRDAHAEHEPHPAGGDHPRNHRSRQRRERLTTIWKEENSIMPETGKVLQVIGPAVDVEFEEGKQPAIYNALRITSEGFEVPAPIDVIVEVQQHLGEGRVRCVAMQPTDGMVRGMRAEDTGAPISVPVGKSTLGRVMNVIG